MKKKVTETKTEANDVVLLANTPTQAESLLHSLEQTVRSISLFMNADKTEFKCFKKDRAISTLSGKPLKLVDLFPYLDNNISSTESDVNICITKLWTATYGNLIFRVVAVSVLLYEYTTWTLNRTHREKAR